MDLAPRSGRRWRGRASEGGEHPDSEHYSAKGGSGNQYSGLKKLLGHDPQDGDVIEEPHSERVDSSKEVIEHNPVGLPAQDDDHQPKALASCSALPRASKPLRSSASARAGVGFRPGLI